LLYVDGVFTETLTTATPSSALGSWVIGTPKELTVIVYEATKTPKTYHIISQKTA
jgi:hypothetical protein